MATRGLPTWPLAGTEADTLPEGERLLLDAARAWAAGGPAGPVGEAALVRKRSLSTLLSRIGLNVLGHVRARCLEMAVWTTFRTTRRACTDGSRF